MACPDDNQVAAFMEGGLSSDERVELERHMDSCPSCRALLGDVAMGATQPSSLDAPSLDGQPTLRTVRGSLKAGEMVDHFCVVRELGEGGMGRVYLARDTQLGRRVALKLIQPSLASSVRAIGMFRREARAMARINHPNIVTVHSVGEHAGVPYVALEYVHGETLAEVHRDGGAPPLEALRIGLGLAEGLAEAHTHGVIHRDLKPSNVLLGTNNRPRIADFGLAEFVRHRAESASLHGYTDAATMIDPARSSPSDGGTPSYMAPEQWRGEEATGATDVWALGVILWEILSGERLFRGNSEVDLAGKICGTDPVPRVSAPGVPEPAIALVEACLSRPVRSRPNAIEVTKRLRECIEQLELSTRMMLVAKGLPDTPLFDDEAPTLDRSASNLGVPEEEIPTLERDDASSSGAAAPTVSEMDMAQRGPAELPRMVIAGVAILLVVGAGVVALGTSSTSDEVPAPASAAPSQAASAGPSSAAAPAPSASASTSTSASSAPPRAKHPPIKRPVRPRTKASGDIFDERF